MRWRRRSLWVALGILVAAAGNGPAGAQINPFPNNPRRLSDADRARMRGSMRAVLASQTVGETASWTSESGAFGGTSELTRTYTRDGMRCGELRHRFEGDDGDISSFDVRACEVPGEGWKFAF